ncbi:MAG: hypothetical protein PHU06_14095 [Gallionella sp.]|nr:hypothetical protein [Gallionella sp.]MDD4960234.1 hypothetical protein [Gallionella sp.]
MGLYAKPIKEYLMGRSAFPADISIGITVLEPNLGVLEKCSFFSLPTSSKDHGTWMHGFHFFGLVFKIFIGKMMSPEFKMLNTFTDQGFVIVKQISQAADFRILANVAKNATARGKLRSEESR